MQYTFSNEYFIHFSPFQETTNKTKDWALVQTAALVINKGVEVRLTLVR